MMGRFARIVISTAWIILETSSHRWTPAHELLIYHRTCMGVGWRLEWSGQLVSQVDTHHCFFEVLGKSNASWAVWSFLHTPHSPEHRGKPVEAGGGAPSSGTLMDLGGDMRSQNGCEDQSFWEDGRGLIHTPQIHQVHHSLFHSKVNSTHIYTPMGWFLGHLGNHKDLLSKRFLPLVWLHGLCGCIYWCHHSEPGFISGYC